ncbi:protein mono-ADP-ribosyltransferase PARP14-like isoform X2 [Cololabis saira]|uniref:protein mono-ADP-ribosyltransferase PARP14-like isoform X2 n=1 Tax=Cololabis saira TaxID=129043 RepID=UPI002AD2BECE|nr:protein mono-ADP-ribosyltransferase PARP14-like isoform X2 [Cololabis saira]
MGDPYKYPVFFDCADMNKERRRRIESYFHIRRKSGGGECGSVTDGGGKVYSVAFKEEEVQKRVLQKTKHVLECAGDTLVLILRADPGPCGSSDSPSLTPGQSATANPDSTTFSQQNQQSVVQSSLPEEYELQLDPYLLRYLRECPKAQKDLETKLAGMSCSSELHSSDETVLVKRPAQSGAGADNWRTEVDTLFDCYICHYELDPHKIKALLKSCAPHQTADEVKLYSEAGMAVVVGERLQVSRRLTDIVSSYVKHPRASLGECQTTVRRIGEAKLRLLWKELKQNLKETFPGLNVSLGEAGQLLLAGSVEEILKAGELISDEERLVLERTVSDKSPHFLAFLSEVYGGPGMLSDYLGLGGKVEVELRDIKLNFFALCGKELDDSVKRMQEKFKDVHFDVPNFSVVPPELCEKLKTKIKEMNQKECRAKIAFGPNRTVYLVGHTREVEELTETVSDFILDHSSTEGTVLLPFPELVQFLPELLELHKFDYSGVSFYPLASSATPKAILEGPSCIVTEVRNRLGPFLDSLVQDTITINLPGAVRYFESISGRDNLLRVAHSHRCLIHLENQHSISRQHLGVVKYNLQNGLQVLVCQGDITKQYADALVNAANENLDHGGGVAAALSKAGGPEVQKESKDIVKQNGKIPTGDVVVTTGGNLKCKKLLHAVGPLGGRSGGREGVLLEKTIKNALTLAETMEFKSIALPCVSSGLFGVPVAVCSEAIVTAIKEFGSRGGRSLSRIILIDNRADVVKAMQEACDRLLQGTGARNSSDVDFQMGATGQGAAAAAAGGGRVKVEIVQGTIETQQVDALVSPMVGHDPLSTRVGNILNDMVGRQLTAAFNKEAGGATLPGDTVVMKSLHPLKCKAVIFLNQVSWDNNQNGSAVQALRQGIQKILAACTVRGFTSVALPVLGTGAVLRFPHRMASKVLMEEVGEFEKNRAGRSPLLVRIVVHPKDKESSKAFQSIQEVLHLKGFTNDVNPDQATFYRQVSVAHDEVTAMLGGVQLQMILGNIINAGTDVIVNTTNFTNHQAGVSKAILTAAGPTVSAELAKVGIPPDYICSTRPGSLACKEIIHANFGTDPQLIRKNCKNILKLCEKKGHVSVAFPAVSTGEGSVDAAEACKAMLDGMTGAITDLKPKSVSLIRIVILLQPVFQAFRSELMNRFGQIASSHLSLKEKAKVQLKKFQAKCSRPFGSSSPQSQSFTPPKPQPVVLRVISCAPDVIRTVKRDLEGILQKELLERLVDVDHFLKLDAMESDAVLGKVSVSGISLELKRCLPETADGSRAGDAGRSEARNRSEAGDEFYVLKGLKEDVLSVIELINKAVQKALCEDLRDKEEATMALHIQWSMKEGNTDWQEVSLHENYVLEQAHLQRQVSVDISASDGKRLKVNLTTKEATDWQNGNVYKLKRSESEADWQLPKHWEPMQEEYFKKVELQPNSNEYQEVAKGFNKTAKYNIHKIERVQNSYLWYAYSVCRQRILTKNGSQDLGEMWLYHGTSAESCNCIERDRFDRSYAGKHAALFGKGVYFAVNANYSATRYSPPDTSGLKRLYVSHVITGRYTVGNSTMVGPPRRGSDSTDCFDSLVDNLQQPSMFVIFHDDQAYPEYLITFK